MKPDPNQSQQSRISQMRQALQLPPYRNLETAPNDALVEEEKLLNYFTMLESEPTSTLARQLIEAGIELPSPDSLDAGEVHDKLWEVIQGIAECRHFITQTNHLSDFELYQKLWLDTLNLEVEEMDESMGKCGSIWDLASGEDEESEKIFLQYYADDFDREFWQISFPKEKLPPRIVASSDRDRNLPQFDS